MATIVFDFDGTIADTLPVVVRMFDQFSGRPPLQPEEIAVLREMTAREVIKELKVPLWRIPNILVQGRRELQKHVGELEAFKGLETVLKQLHTEGHQLHIVSSNSPQVMKTFLKRYDLVGCFGEIRGNAGLFGKGKVVKALLRKHNVAASEVFSVADEVRDIEMARKVGLKPVAVGWGFNAEGVLKKYKPDYFVATPEELLQVLK